MLSVRPAVTWVEGEWGTQGGNDIALPEAFSTCLRPPARCGCVTMQGAGCFDGLAPLRDHLVEVELIDVTMHRGTVPGFGPAPATAAAVAQSLSRTLRPERLAIRALPGGPSPMLMHGRDGPGPPLEFGPAWIHTGGGLRADGATGTLEEGGLLTRLRSLEVRSCHCAHVPAVK